MAHLFQINNKKAINELLAASHGLSSKAKDFFCCKLRETIPQPGQTGIED
jgi:hypothetical protein